jgi:hypothetical protein
MKEVSPMADIWELSEMAEGGEAIVHGYREEEPATKESKVHDDFIKFITVHEDQVRQILCSTRNFTEESFCGDRPKKMYEDSFLWRGVAP